MAWSDGADKKSELICVNLLNVYLTRPSLSSLCVDSIILKSVRFQSLCDMWTSRSATERSSVMGNAYALTQIQQFGTFDQRST